MSKVIHLSDDAHNQAKAFCREHGLKMSDWVAALIEAAIRQGAPGLPAGSSNVRAMVQKKKYVERIEDSPQTSADGLPVYASPPFWAAKAHSP